MLLDAGRIKAVLRLHGVLWTEDLVSDLVGSDCTCPPYHLDRPTKADPNCPGVLRDQRQRRQMAAAWDDGMLAHTQGLGSEDNPYRSRYCDRGPCSNLLGHEGPCQR